MAVLENPVTVGAPGVVLRPDQLIRYARLDEAPAPARWERFVEKLWSVHWDLPSGTAYLSSTAPVPTTNLTFEDPPGRAGVTRPGWFVTGVISRRRFDVRMTGSGGVVGVKFRPGGFAALTGVEGWRCRGAVLPAPELFAGRWAWEHPDAVPTATDAAELLTSTVTALRTGTLLEGELDRLEQALALMRDHSSTTVETVADTLGLSPRTLQRLFRRLVGVGPKWMLTRARLHDAIARLDAGYTGPVAELAYDLGWFDQAHFIRDFTALVGVPPGRYRDADQDPHDPTDVVK